LLDRFGTGVFKHMTDPGDHNVYLLFGQYFRDPRVGDGLLGPGMSGVACANIRSALNELGYGVKSNDLYDAELKETVLQLQKDMNHPAKDGYFGPGTRELLVRTLYRRFGEEPFRSMHKPTAVRLTEVGMIEPDHEQEHLNNLHNKMSDGLSMSELRTACFLLGVDYENLPGNTKMDKVTEVLWHMKRRKTIYMLENVLYEMRPDLTQEAT
jgi:hypothetical protein